MLLPFRPPVPAGVDGIVSLFWGSPRSSISCLWDSLFVPADTEAVVVVEGYEDEVVRVFVFVFVRWKPYRRIHVSMVRVKRALFVEIASSGDRFCCEICAVF